jgi:hypothetical protein
MPVVPIIEREQGRRALPSGGFNAQLPSSYGNVPVPQDTGMTRLAEAVGEYARQAKEKGDQIALLDAQRQLDEWEAVNIFDPSTGILAKKGRDAIGAPQKLLGDYDKFITQLDGTLSNDAQRMAMQKMAVSRRDGLMRTGYTHERGEMNFVAQETRDTTVKTGQNRAALNYNNPAVVESSINNAKAAELAFARVQGLPDESITQRLLEIESEARIGVLNRMADNDPRAAIDYFKTHQNKFSATDLLVAERLIKPAERKYKAVDAAQAALGSVMPKTSRDEIIDFVSILPDSLEGGDKTVADGDGMARFGINSAAHPDVNLEELTPEKARAFYVEKYWKRFNLDDQPATMRLAAFQFLIQNETEGKKAIEQANGDPRKLLELQTDFYRRLVKQDPEKYSKNFDGWMSRVARTEAQIAAMSGELPSESDLYNQIDAQTDDPDVAADARNIVSERLKTMRDDRKNSYADASETAWRYVSNGQDVPASVEARMNPKDVLDMRKFVGNQDPDPAFYAYVRQRVVTGQPIMRTDPDTGQQEEVPLTELRWQLGSEFNNLLEIEQDPKKRVNARTVDDVIKDAGQILIGQKEPQTQDQFRRMEAFRRSVDNEIQAMQKATGKVAGPSEVQAITDRLLLTVNPDDSWSNKALFEMTPDQSYTIAGIDNKGKFYVNGEENSYNSIVDKITRDLVASNIPVNDQTILEAFAVQLKNGTIVKK